MHGRTFAALFLCSLFIAVAGDAQNPDTKEKPVWTLEFIKVGPEQYALALGQLDDQWMRIREEAKREGAVVSYERISNAGLRTPGREDLSKTIDHPFLDVRQRAAHNLSILPSSRKSGEVNRSVALGMQGA